MVRVVAIQAVQLVAVDAQGEGVAVGFFVLAQRLGFEYPQQGLAVAVGELAEQWQVAVAVFDVEGARRAG